MKKPPSPFVRFRRSLLERIATRVTPLGYASRISDQKFIERTEFGSRILSLTFLSGGDTYWVVNAHASLRVDAVEDLVLADSTSPPREKKRSATIGGELGNIADGRWTSWPVTPEVDLDWLADDVVRKFVSFGRPFLERLSNLETLLDVLSESGSGAFTGFPETRCQRAIALALLLGHNDRVPAIVAGCGSNFRRHQPGNERLFAMIDERGISLPSES